MSERYYKLIGRPEDLDAIEKALRHCEYLGNIGASRNILLRVDGDGSGRIKIERTITSMGPNEEEVIVDTIAIDKDKYNTKQNLGMGATVGVYDIG